METLNKNELGQWSLEKAEFNLAESKKAYEPSLRPQEHQERIKMHDKAAMIHANSGNKESAAWHRQQAGLHYQALTGKAPAVPTHMVKEELDKKAPKGVDPEKHERCVMDVKEQGHDVGSAHAICTASMKKADSGKFSDEPAQPKSTMTQEEHDAAMQQYLDRGKQIKKIPAKSGSSSSVTAKHKAKSTKPKYSPFGKSEDEDMEKQQGPLSDTPAPSNIGEERLVMSDNGQWYIEPIKTPEEK
jgi:hypothetical protein